MTFITRTGRIPARRTGRQYVAMVGIVCCGLAGAARAQAIGSFDPADNNADSANLPRAGTGLTNPGSVDPAEQGGAPGDADGAKNQALPPPPALPGSHAQPTEVAPAEKVVADMDPTTALFDAINRGDNVAARDAISRGANLDGRNVLGLTPIELSVDLNRNDISFLLLSMHAETATVQNSAGRPAAHTPRASSRRIAAGRRPATVLQAGGTPAPSAGFLGFEAFAGS